MYQPEELRFTKEHEWLHWEKGFAVLGISDHAQGLLGDLVYVDLPAKDAEVKKDRVIGSLESVKSVGEIYSPVSGQILEVNEQLNEDPSLVNSDPYGVGWMVRMRIDDPQELETLMDYQAYQKYIQDNS